MADAGLLPPATLAHHGLKSLVDEHPDLGSKTGANAGDKFLTLVMSALAGRRVS